MVFIIESRKIFESHSLKILELYGLLNALSLITEFILETKKIQRQT